MNNPATPAIRHTGVIGLGALGRPVAELLLRAGYAVAVYDVRAAAVSALQVQGATVCESPAAVAEQSELIISLVSDRAQTDDIVFGVNGMQGHLRAHTILALGSTLGPEPVRQIAAALEAQAVEVLDIPISGGKVLALVTLDNGKDHTRPNTLGPKTLVEFAGVLDELAVENEISFIVGLR